MQLDSEVPAGSSREVLSERKPSSRSDCSGMPERPPSRVTKPNRVSGCKKAGTPAEEISMDPIPTWVAVSREGLVRSKAAVAAALASANEHQEFYAGNALACAVSTYAQALIKTGAPDSRRNTLQLLARVAEKLLEERTEIVSDQAQDQSWQHLSTGHA